MNIVRAIRLGLAHGVRIRRIAKYAKTHRLSFEEAKEALAIEDAEAKAARALERSEQLMRQAMAARAGIGIEDANLL